MDSGAEWRSSRGTRPAQAAGGRGSVRNPKREAEGRQGREGCTGFGLTASGLFCFLAGACACLGFLWWHYGPLLQRHRLHQQQLHRQRQLQHQQQDLLRHLRIQLRLLRQEQQPQVAGAGGVDCNRLSSSNPAAPSMAAPHYGQDQQTILEELSQVLKHLRHLENVTTTTTTTTTVTRTTVPGTAGVPGPAAVPGDSIASITTPIATLPTTPFATLPTTHTTTTSTVTTTTTLTEWRPPARFAFVTMAHDPPGAPPEHLYGALAVARMLQRLSSYPLALLTDAASLPDGTDLARAVSGLNVHILPLQQVDVPPQLAQRFTTLRWKVILWKLQIWRLEHFEKLIWLDSDSLITRSIDWLFQRPGMWAMRDDEECKMRQRHANAGILLLYPSSRDYYGLLSYAGSRLHQLPESDAQLIHGYFSEQTHRDLNLLSDVEAGFGQCLGKAPTPYRNPNKKPVWGVWSVPAFVHKSGGWKDSSPSSAAYTNQCFSINMTRQHYVLGRTVLNVCHYHPLGQYWRNHFCGAAASVGGIRLPEVGAFCDDGCWALGRRRDLPRGRGWGAGRATASCGPLSVTIRYPDYYTKLIGWPPLEAPSHQV